jgi:hypothetical protein
LRRVKTDGDWAERADRAADSLRNQSNWGVVGGSSVGTTPIQRLQGRLWMEIGYPQSNWLASRTQYRRWQCLWKVTPWCAPCWLTPNQQDPASPNKPGSKKQGEWRQKETCRGTEDQPVKPWCTHV